MLVAENLKKTYKIRNMMKFNNIYEEIQAVHNISLHVDKGQIVGLLGVNGAGKTTTIKMLTTILAPTSGIIKYDDLDAIKDYKKIRSKINMIIGGERNLYWRLTAYENMNYFGSLYRIDQKSLNLRINQLIKLVHLEDASNIPVERYSKGMKQRLQIIRGLINDPSYVFLDEPTIGLDISIASEIRKYIKKMSTDLNKGLLLTTHNIREAEELCDYIYVIDNGKVVLEGTSEFIKKSSNNNVEIKIKIKEEITLLEKFLKETGLDFMSYEELDHNSNSIIIKLPRVYVEYLIDLIINHGFKLKEIQTIEADLESTLLEIIERMR